MNPNQAPLGNAGSDAEIAEEARIAFELMQANAKAKVQEYSTFSGPVHPTAVKPLSRLTMPKVPYLNMSANNPIDHAAANYWNTAPEPDPDPDADPDAPKPLRKVFDAPDGVIHYYPGWTPYGQVDGLGRLIKHDTERGGDDRNNRGDRRDNDRRDNSRNRDDNRTPDTDTPDTDADAAQAAAAANTTPDPSKPKPGDRRTSRGSERSSERQGAPASEATARMAGGVVIQESLAEQDDREAKAQIFDAEIVEPTMSGKEVALYVEPVEPVVEQQDVAVSGLAEAYKARRAAPAEQGDATEPEAKPRRAAPVDSEAKPRRAAKEEPTAEKPAAPVEPKPKTKPEAPAKTVSPFDIEPDALATRAYLSRRGNRNRRDDRNRGRR